MVPALGARSSQARLIRPRAVASNAVIGITIFVVTEAMFFAGLISALAIVKAGTGGDWPPPGQPRLPLEATAFNTLVLLASGVTVWLAGRAHADRPERTQRLMLTSLGLGATFVLLQGIEWQALLRDGMTLTSSHQGSFFHLIVGAHALHALVAIAFIGIACRRSSRGELNAEWFRGFRIYWYFVVLLWPLLYLKVYL
jgi:cytochrome c oxidase subunit 3